MFSTTVMNIKMFEVYESVGMEEEYRPSICENTQLALFVSNVEVPGPSSSSGEFGHDAFALLLRAFHHLCAGDIFHCG